jgi:Rod binding domain-containing protein
MNSLAVSAGSNPGIATPEGDRKTAKAGQDFEAVLLETLLRPLEQAFSSLPGKNSTPGSDTYGGLGIEALATGLAQAGGIGIGRLILSNLQKTNQINSKQAARKA